MQTGKRLYACLVGIVCLCGVLACALSCNRTAEFRKNQSHADVSDEDIAAGQQLAGTYCKSCHLLPDPSLLDAKTWENGVLPQMGPRLGIFQHGPANYPVSNSPYTNMGKGFYPDKPLVSQEQWQRIIDYYTALAPDTLSGQQRKKPLRPDSSLFKVELPSRRYIMPLTCMVRIDSADRQLLVSDVERKQLYTCDAQLRYKDSTVVGGAIVDAIFQPPYMIGCDIGQLFPNNAKAGGAFRFKRDARGGWSQEEAPLFKDLIRPVELAAADLNGDGKVDYLVCEFGYTIGQLSWMENKGNGQFEAHVIRAVPGAIQARVLDYNHDGKPDLFVAFAQGDEGIFLFTNKGNGLFEGEQILRFPPCYGTSYFELDDFNKDGHPDILYTCGDNGDYSPILKPYHGVYIFMNDGQNHFTQRYFFPINGCYRAMARDFSGDGNLDIAAISYFADYQRQPEEGFVFLRHNGPLDFTPYSVPGTESGRWISMDVGDLDGDGKPEIVLGNCSTGPGGIRPKTDFKNGPPFMVLHLSK
jgi:hypothetical protein